MNPTKSIFSDSRQNISAAARRIGWGLADQSLSSLSNFIVGIAVARSVSVSEFGVYALAFSVYSLILGISRALTTEPYAVVFTAAPESEVKWARAAASGIALAVGVAFMIVALAVSQTVPAGTRSIIVVLAMVMPGLLVQDSWRHIFFAAGKGSSAFANDMLWTLLLIPAFAVVFLVGRVSAASLLLAWGSAAMASAVVGMVQARTVPNPLHAALWLRKYRMLWPRYLGEGAAINGAQQMVFFALGLVAGLAPVGQLKLVMVILGPVNVLVQGIGVVAVPEAARALKSGRKRQNFVAVGISVIVAVGSLTWGLLIYLMPDHWGTALAGAGWAAASFLVLPMFLTQVFNGANTGPAVSLRAMGAARRSMWIRIGASGAVVAFAGSGVVLWGVAGAAWGMTLAAALNAVLWIQQFVRVSRQRREHPDAVNGFMAGLSLQSTSRVGLSHE